MRKNPDSFSASSLAQRTREVGFVSIDSPIGSVRGSHNHRSQTLSSSRISEIISNCPATTSKAQLNKVKLSPLPNTLSKTRTSTRNTKVLSITLKRRFTNINIYSKKIPQSDHMIFLIEKIPTFDFVREKNLKKNTMKMLKLVNPIMEDTSEDEH
jgi:hypothetical protein